MKILMVSEKSAKIKNEQRHKNIERLYNGVLNTKSDPSRITCLDRNIFEA